MGRGYGAWLWGVVMGLGYGVWLWGVVMGHGAHTTAHRAKEGLPHTHTHTHTRPPVGRSGADGTPRETHTA